MIQWKLEKLRVKVFFFLLMNRQREIEELKEKDGAKISSPISVGGSVGKRKQDDIQKLRNLEEQVGFKSHYDIRTSVSVKKYCAIFRSWN